MKRHEGHEEYMKRRMREEEEAYQDRKWDEHKQMLDNQNKKPQIFESPDGGKTVYARDLGAPHETRKIVKQPAFIQVGKDEHEVVLSQDALDELIQNNKVNQEIEEEWNGYDDEHFQDEYSLNYDDYPPYNFKFELIEYAFNEDELLEDIKKYIDSTYDAHYAQGRYQSTQFIEDCGHGMGFALGNVLKYAQRYGKKDGFNRADLMKVIHYGIIALSIHDRENS